MTSVPLNLEALRDLMVSMAKDNGDQYGVSYVPEKIGWRWRIKRTTSFPHGIRKVSIANFITIYPMKYWRWTDAMDKALEMAHAEARGDKPTAQVEGQAKN